MVRCALLVLVLSGCDSLFNLDHVPAGGGLDGGITVDDGAQIDGLIDAETRCTVTADEDADGLVDPCDPCPTLGMTNPTDDDMDGLPNVCDPNLGLGMKDRLAFRGLFAEPTDLALFNQSGATYVAANHGQVMVTAGGHLTTNDEFAATKVEVRVASATGATPSALIRIKAGLLECDITGADCATGTNTAQTCATLKNGSVTGSGATLNVPLGALSRISLFKATATSSTVKCEIAAASSVQASLTSAIPQAQIVIEPGNQSMYVNSVLVYESQ